jgi:hypothetical protein
MLIRKIHIGTMVFKLDVTGKQSSFHLFEVTSDTLLLHVQKYKTTIEYETYQFIIFLFLISASLYRATIFDIIQVATSEAQKQSTSHYMIYCNTCAHLYNQWIQ